MWLPKHCFAGWPKSLMLDGQPKITMSSKLQKLFFTKKGPHHCPFVLRNKSSWDISVMSDETWINKSSIYPTWCHTIQDTLHATWVYLGLRFQKGYTKTQPILWQVPHQLQYVEILFGLRLEHRWAVNKSYTDCKNRSLDVSLQIDKKGTYTPYAVAVVFAKEASFLFLPSSSIKCHHESCLQITFLQNYNPAQHYEC